MAGQRLSAIYLEYDVQYLLILDKYGAWIDYLLWQCEDDQQWLPFSYDLSAYAGQTISLQFGTYNTGVGGVTSMYIDEVSLEVCWPEEPTVEAEQLWLPLISKNAQGTPPPPRPSPTPGDYPYPLHHHQTTIPMTSLQRRIFNDQRAGLQKPCPFGLGSILCW